MKLSVIVPVYNEVGSVEKVIRAVQEAPVNGLEREIVLVDDGSTDGTRELLRNRPAEPGVSIHFHPQNFGKGRAIRTGLQQASGDIILVQDADLEYDPRDYPHLLQPILEGRASVVYGSRFLGGPRKAMLFWHAVGNQLLTLITNILYDSTLSDMETGYKVFRAEVIKPIPLRAQRFDFEPEITAKILKRHYRIYEVPITYTGREYHEGKKITWRDAIPALWALVRYRFLD